MQEKNLSSLTRRFSKKFHKGKGLDNRGASLVMVLMVMALIFVLVSIILMITVTNIFMKDAAEKNTKNFYDAEASMDEIRAGLATVCGRAANYAKLEAEKLNDTTKFDENYKKFYAEYVYATLSDPSIADAPYRGTGIPTDARHRQYRIGSEQVGSGSSATDMRSSIGGLTTDQFDKDYDGLSSCLKGTKKRAADPTDPSVGGEVVNEDATGSTVNNYINIYPSKGEVVLLGVKVKYTDKHDFVTSITTDIKLSCPPAASAEEATLNNILYYTLITDDSLQISAGSRSSSANEFQGNIFAGYNDSQITDYNINMTQGGGTGTGQICYFLGGGNIDLISSDLSMNNSQMWIKGLKLLGGGDKYPSGSVITGTTGSSFTMTAGSDSSSTRLYMQDDLNLGNKSNVRLSGQLFGFGNPDDLSLSDVHIESSGDVKGEGSLAITNDRNLPSQTEVTLPSGGTRKRTIKEDITEKPYEYSSAILVNGKSTTLDLSGLSSMKLAGSAYVNANPNKNGENANNDIRTGEAVSIKPSQRAYLVPADNLVFSANPVSGKVFDDKLKTDFVNAASVDAQGYYLYPSGPYAGQRLPVVTDPDTGAVEMEDVVLADGSTIQRHPKVDVDNIKITVTDYITGTPGTDYNASKTDAWRDYVVSGYGQTFRELGINNIRVAAFPGGPIRYFFMSFRDDKSANAFYKLYYQNVQRSQTLEERLNEYVSGGLKLPGGVANTDTSTRNMYFSRNDDFYFNGNLIATGSPMIKVSDTWTAMSNYTSETDADSTEDDMKESSGSLYDSYYALLTNLTTREDMLSDLERDRTLFENIIDESKLTPAFSTRVDGSVIGNGSQNKRYYVSDTGKGCILCHDVSGSSGPVTISEADRDILGQIYAKNYGGDSTKAEINLIVSDTEVDIDSSINEINGLILSKGKIVIDHDMTVTQDASSVIVAMNSVHVTENPVLGSANEGYTLTTPRDIFRNPSLYAVGGRNVDSFDSTTETVTLPSLVTYENWTRE